MSCFGCISMDMIHWFLNTTNAIHYPIGYASTGTKVVGVSTSNPQLNLTLMDDENQNLTAGQKLLLHWHHRFGHLNMPAAQRILRAVPFLTEKFKAASKCDTPHSRRPALIFRVPSPPASNRSCTPPAAAALARATPSAIGLQRSGAR